MDKVRFTSLSRYFNRGYLRIQQQIRNYHIYWQSKLTMKKLILFLALMSCVHVSQAQFGNWGGGATSKIKGKITGELIDSITNEKIGFATVVLKKAVKEKDQNGTLSEDNGKFKLAELKMGKYDLYLSFIGYNDKVIKTIELTGKSPDYNCGQILLSPADYLLDEIEVTAKRALFENKVDKLVFNAEDDASITGGDATDVLRKVPTLSVDLEGNVSLRGSQNVRILINGKPSGMFSSNVADALKMFPADQIKKVEVITSPGAKYDGEGSAGIINIITKKENIEGISGSVSGSLRNRQSNGNLSLNAGKGRFGFSSSGANYADLCVLRGPSNFNYSAAQDCQDQQDIEYTNYGVTRTSRLGFNGSASAFYDFNAYNAINSSLSFRGFGFDTEGNSVGVFNTSADPLSFDRFNTGDNLFSGYDWNTDYTKKFEGNDKQELVIACQGSTNVQNQDNYVSDTGLLSRDEQIFNDGDNIELTGQIDYVQPIGKSNKLEVGVKSVIRDIKSDSEFRPRDVRADPEFVLDPTRSFLFNYDQDVYAGYLSYNFFIQKFNIVTGLRYEKTNINGDGALKDGTVDPETRDILAAFPLSYENWLPNIAISRSMKKFRTLKIAYSKRIQRPSLYYINPFRNTTDFANLVVGNPRLSPELTDQLELSYNTNLLGFTIFSSFYYKHNTAIIEQVATRENNNILRTSFDNVGVNNSLGVNIFTSKSIGKLTVRGGGDIYSYDASGTINGKDFDNQALSYRLFTGGEYSFSGTFKADFFGFFQAPRFTLQGENASFSIYGVGLKKEFKKFSLGIKIIEPFSKYKSFDSDITGDGFRQITQFAIPFRSLGVNFSYKFGKVDFKARKSKIKNTDQKAGEGDGQGGGGQGGGGMGG